MGNKPKSMVKCINDIEHLLICINEIIYIKSYEKTILHKPTKHNYLKLLYLHFDPIMHPKLLMTRTY